MIRCRTVGGSGVLGRWLSAACVLLAVVTFAVADESSAPAPAWEWTDVNGKVVQPFADTNTEFVVVTFVGLHCPVANYFHPTLRRLAAESGGGVDWVFFHPDDDVTAEAARKHAADFGVCGPVVLDRGQATARRLAAEVTPESFVIGRDGTIHYRGRINDMFIRPSRKRPKPRTHDLKDALAALGRDAPVAVAETKPIGCFIYFDPPLKTSSESVR